MQNMTELNYIETCRIPHKILDFVFKENVENIFGKNMTV